MCITYIQFYRVCQAQGIDRASFPYVGYFQPYCAYLGGVVMLIVILFYGYKAFDPWDVEIFFPKLHHAAGRAGSVSWVEVGQAD